MGVLEEEDCSALESWRLLFVHVDDEKEGEMDMFYFKVEDADRVISSLRFGDEEVGMCEGAYGREGGDEKQSRGGCDGFEIIVEVGYSKMLARSGPC